MFRFRAQHTLGALIDNYWRVFMKEKDEFYEPKKCH